MNPTVTTSAPPRQAVSCLYQPPHIVDGERIGFTDPSFEIEMDDKRTLFVACEGEVFQDGDIGVTILRVSDGRFVPIEKEAWGDDEEEITEKIRDEVRRPGDLEELLDTLAARQARAAAAEHRYLERSLR